MICRETEEQRKRAKNNRDPQRCHSHSSQSSSCFFSNFPLTHLTAEFHLIPSQNPHALSLFFLYIASLLSHPLHIIIIYFLPFLLLFTHSCLGLIFLKFPLPYISPNTSHLPPLPTAFHQQVDQHSEDWESLEKVRLPLSLNLSQCKLELKQYQEVVELNDRLLKSHKGRICRCEK